VRVAILTISDSVVSATRIDASGPAVRRRCEELGWPVAALAALPDEASSIAEQLRQWADTNVASLILTTGGTGIAPRDVTPEATRAIVEREIPGMAELMRAEGLKQTIYSSLSRAVAGTRGRSLIVNLPGSTKGALFSLEAIARLVPHAIDLLNGKTAHSNECETE
jgi:molybdenum cofactor synthesis domain-containing protein